MSPDTAAYHEVQRPDDRAICEALAVAIDRHLPDAENKVWHRHPVWFLAGNPVVGYAKRKAGVHLLFWSGQSFEEDGLEDEGSFKAAGVSYTSVAEIDPLALERWLGQARTIQWDYQNIVRRKGRLERLVGNLVGIMEEKR